MKLVYDGLRHNMFLKIKYGNNWLTALQATINMQQIFGTDINALRIGFTASNGNAYYDTDRIYSLRYRRAEINSAKSIVKENGTLKNPKNWKCSINCVTILVCNIIVKIIFFSLFLF